jgi:secreted PhoX family phosphatase
MSENLKDTDLSFDEFDERRRPATVTTSFDDVLDRAQSRRGFMKSAAMFGSATFVMSVWNAAASKAPGRPNFDFEPVRANTLDTVTVPNGYSWRPALVRWRVIWWSKPRQWAESGTRLWW